MILKGAFVQGFIFILLPLLTIGLSIVDPGKTTSISSLGLHVHWLSSFSLAIIFPDNTTDVINVIPASNMNNIHTPCLFSGKLENDPNSVVAVSGCKESHETTISIASKLVIGGLTDIVLVNGTSYSIGDHANIHRFKRQGEIQISKDDFLIAPPVQNSVDYSLKPSSASAFPASVVLETSIRYDNSLLQKFDGSHIETKQWIDRVVQLARPRLSHHSLNVPIQLKVLGDVDHQDQTIEADEDTIYRLRSEIKPAKLLSYFCRDIGGGVVGIAFVGTACRTDGYAININEYYSDTYPELLSARVFVHELGHNVGMSHDFDTRHAGRSCNGKGLMSYGDKPDAWSSCSNSDFSEWYKDQGFKCLEEVLCPSGYQLMKGDIPGWGQIKGGISTTYAGCGAQCMNDQNCCSFEFSNTDGICNLNSDCFPTVGSYKDYRFCIKDKLSRTMCPNGYSLAEGDIPGWGQIKGRISTTVFGCCQECAKLQDCCSFEYSNTAKICNLNSGCKPTVGPYKDYKFCIREKMKCPSGYADAEGDIPGWGQIKGRISTTFSGCGQECAKHQDCCSFEYSNTAKMCNLNSGCKPTVGPYKDYKFCIKDV